MQPRTSDPRQVPGVYQLTMTASASCALPAELDYVFIERLPSGMNLAYSGTAVGSVEQGGIVATLRGRIQHRSPAASTGATCDATDHRMEFVR